VKAARERVLHAVSRLFAIYNLAAILIGGLLAALFMRPEMDAGPVRLGTYLAFAFASALLARKFLAIVRRSEDGNANLFIVASCYWWISFGMTAIVIEYLIAARAYGLWPHWGESLTERVSYFFISGAAVGVMFMALTFQFVPTEWLIGRRVPAWPLTIGMRKRLQYSGQAASREREDRAEEREDRATEREDRATEREDRSVERHDRAEERRGEF
jgi:hypothetical protein